MRDTLERICAGENLTQAQSAALFGTLVEGDLAPVEIAAVLVGLRTKGESPAEIAGAAEALLAKVEPFPRPDRMLCDTCGTGGDGASTINISTAAAIVAAEMGLAVAKHGNRAVTSRCGSADVLEAFGVALETRPEVAARCLEEAGLCFLYAPLYHAGMRHAMPVRRTLAVRTVMNLVGPLVNPARPEYQVLGVAEPRLLVPMAQAAGIVGRRAALVVHGDGIDEIAVHGVTRAALLKHGGVVEIEMEPKEAGLGRFPLDALHGSDAAANARALYALLRGCGEEAHEAVVAMNAGALAWLAGRAVDLRAGVFGAIDAIRSGRCAARLARLAEVSRGA